MSKHLPRAGQFRPQLDSLRAFAVIGVVLSHTSPQYTVLQYIRPGDRGVQLFFVLSGFLISGILFDAIKARGVSALIPFFVRRVLRLLPIFYLVLAVTTLVAWEELKNSWAFHAFYLSNFRFISLGDWEEYTAHFWTLSLEEQFYLIWPIVLVFSPARYWHIAIACLLLIGLATRFYFEITGKWVQFGVGLIPTYYADDFAGGAAIALWLRSRPSIALVKRVAFLTGITGAIALAIIYASLGPLRASNSTLDVTGWMMISVGLILLCYVGIDGRIGKWIESRPVLVTGRISYGIYLWHVLAIIAAQNLANYSGLYGALGQFGWITVFIGATIFSIVLAGLSWYFIESRILALKNKVPYHKSIAAEYS